METLILLSAESTIHINSSTGQNIFKSGSINEVHPVVHRLKRKPENEFDTEFRYIKTRSEKYGDEEGFLATHHQHYQFDIKFIDLDIYEEQKAREKLCTKTVESIDKYTKQLEYRIRGARLEYIKYLESLGYIEEELYDEETEYYMIHPLYIKQWRKKPNDDYPDWAVKEIGTFPDNKEKNNEN